MRTLLLVGLLAGCGPRFDAQLARALDAHDLPAARKAVEAELSTNEAADRRGLALLERASLALADDDPKAALADVIAADGLLDFADVASAHRSKQSLVPTGMLRFERNGLIRYLGKPLLLTPHERLGESVLGLEAAWALGDDDAARVEARRLAVVREDLHSYAIAAKAYEIVAAGGLLAAWAYESQDREEACLWMREAARAMPRTLLERERARLCDRRESVHDTPDSGVLRGIVDVGYAPKKAYVFTAQGTTKVCLHVSEAGPPAVPVVTLDGAAVAVEELVDLASVTLDFWTTAFAFTWSCDGALAVHAWQTAPARIYAFSTEFPPGVHRLRVDSGGQVRERTVQVAARRAGRVVLSLPFSVQPGALPHAVQEAPPVK